MLSRVRDYILDHEFRLTLLEGRFFAINFSKIVALEESRVSFLTDYGRIVVKGKNFVLQRLLDSEVLVGGEVLGVEVFYE